MTREARLTQKRLEGEILRLLEGISATLYVRAEERPCAFCKKYEECEMCPIAAGSPDDEDCLSDVFDKIDRNMETVDSDAIPGALAIYMWLYDL